MDNNFIKEFVQITLTNIVVFIIVFIIYGLYLLYKKSKF